MSTWSEILMLKIINQMSFISFGLMSSLTHARTEFLSVDKPLHLDTPYLLTTKKPKVKGG